ncbi:MAG: DEAD/DEAH box helicase [Synergistaceae bacterium]|jgi:DEAD/DEAH box helicase domain-containing protein|nr:DEAD/DEAH box helicase [Synergistaceae bacterium]
MNRSVFSRGVKDMGGMLAWLESLPGDITAHEVMPASQAVTADWPDIDAGLIAALQKRGINRLYTHQARAIALAASGRDCVVVTPTASGKTICYNVPVLNTIIDSPSARAIYLFPTKALAQDQLSELYELVDDMKLDVRTYTYDGDTPQDARTKVRSAGHIVITNPDMLHTGILPHHTKWKNLFENLKYVVIDELHSYRGIFGSHFALILQRLARICDFYGSKPTFICCSATIANPKELARELIGRTVEMVEENGAPSPERHIIFYNPPVVNSQLGIRRSSLLEVSRIAIEAVCNGIRTIVFTRSRINVELLLTYLQAAASKRGIDPNRITGYRAGYLPNERRAIERGLRDGSIHCVISTNALELGVDIGSLEFSVLHGYPGSVASAWQQIGRSGRRASGGGGNKISAAVMVASSLQIDQFLSANPSYFFGASPEHARINPTNPYIQIGHIKCSSFELPFYAGESFGKCDTEDALDYLARHGVLHMEGGRYHWQADSYPAASLSLRSATSENVVIHDVTDASSPKVIGQMDRKTAPTLIFPQAIYFHLGEPYQVEELDFERMRCYVKRVDVDYYTDGDAAARIEVLDEMGTKAPFGWGEVLLATRPTIYKKIKLLTHENVGYGNIHLPEEQMHTTAFWIIGPQAAAPAGAGDDSKPAAQGKSDSLWGLANLVRTIAPLFLMCDRGDIIVKAHERDPHFRAPTIFVADNVPGGIGLSEALFDLGPKLLAACRDALTNCKCKWGCPACIGATVEDGGEKAAVMELLRDITPAASAFL